MNQIKLIFISSFIAIWLIPIVTQIFLGTISTWIYVDLFFCFVTAGFMYFVYKEVTQ